MERAKMPSEQWRKRSGKDSSWHERCLKPAPMHFAPDFTTILDRSLQKATCAAEEFVAEPSSDHLESFVMETEVIWDGLIVSQTLYPDRTKSYACQLHQILGNVLSDPRPRVQSVLGPAAEGRHKTLRL